MAEPKKWTEEQERVFEKKAMELYDEGHEEFEIEDIAAQEAAQSE